MNSLINLFVCGILQSSNYQIWSIQLLEEIEIHNLQDVLHPGEIEMADLTILRYQNPA